jgi:hypothetical protein
MEVSMKTIILAGFAILTLSIGSASTLAATYHTPAHNFYQNNWMGGD